MQAVPSYVHKRISTHSILTPTVVQVSPAWTTMRTKYREGRSWTASDACLTAVDSSRPTSWPSPWKRTLSMQCMRSRQHAMHLTQWVTKDFGTHYRFLTIPVKENTIDTVSDERICAWLSFHDHSGGRDAVCKIDTTCHAPDPVNWHGLITHFMTVLVERSTFNAVHQTQ